MLTRHTRFSSYRDSAARLLFGTTLLIATSGCGSHGPSASTGHASGVVRVAVIGGMVETGFWHALAARFEEQTGHRVKVKVVAAGPKYVIAPAFRSGQADFITMHSCDSIINLVADGFAVDPQPWLKNDLIIVGPHDDPANIRGKTSAIEAFAAIAKAKAPFVVHSSLGAQEVMRELLDVGDVAMPSDQLTILFTDRARDVLKIAAAKHAYTLVGRIPFLKGKLPNEGLEIMVRGDPGLRRPYLAAVANPQVFPQANCAAARELAAFLITPQTQSWIATYGKGQLDDQPLFFSTGK